MIIDLLNGIKTELDTSAEVSADLLRSYLTWYGYGDVPSGQTPPYMNWNMTVGGQEDYVFEDTPTRIYQDIEVTFNIVTIEKSPLQIGNAANSLKNLFRRSNFVLTNGRVISAMVIDNLPQQNGDSDGFEWLVGIQFKIGT